MTSVQERVKPAVAAGQPRADDELLFGAIRYPAAFGLLLGLSALFRLLYTPWVPLTGDEVMHWEWSRHLALGYPEHPPMVAWLIAFNTSLFGTAQWSVRLASVLAITGVFTMAFRLGRELFGARAAFFGVVPLMLTPAFNIGGTLANTDGLLAFFWTLTIYGVKKAVLDQKRAGWLLAGIAAGLCLLSKLPAVFLFVATALLLATLPEGRRWLRRWEPYAAAALAVLFFLPPLIWNARHDWFTVKMRVGHQAAEGFTLVYFFELLGVQLLIASPVLFVWAMWGLWKCWRNRQDARAVLLGLYTAVPFFFYMGYSVTARASPHWPAIAYVTAFLAAGAWSATATTRRNAGARLALACLPAVLITAVVYLIPLIPEKLTFSWSYAARPDKISDKLMKEIFDWGQIGRAVQQELDRGSGDQFVLTRSGYGLGGLLAFYTPEHPQVFLWEETLRNGFAYELWKGEADLRGWNAVIVEDFWNETWFDEIRCCFETLSEPRRVDILQGDRVIREFYVFYGTNFSGFPPHLAGFKGS